MYLQTRHTPTPSYDPTLRLVPAGEPFSSLSCFPAVPLLPHDPTPFSLLLSLTDAALYCSCSCTDLSCPQNILICSLKIGLFSSVSVCQHLAHCLVHSKNSIHLCWMNVWITLWLGISLFFIIYFQTILSLSLNSSKPI